MCWIDRERWCVRTLLRGPSGRAPTPAPRCALIDLHALTRRGDALLPEGFCFSIVIQDLLTLDRILELDLCYSFARPIEKELRGGFADEFGMTFYLEIEGAGRSEAIGARDFCHGTDQEPTALVKAEATDLQPLRTSGGLN